MRSVSVACVLLAVGVAISMSAAGQSSPDPQTEAVAKAIAQTMDDPDSIPAGCDSPMALDQMMSAIQRTVGDRIHDQLVDIRDPRTIFVKTNSYSCHVVTVWGQTPPTPGVFTRYLNAVGKVVYSWNGESPTVSNPAPPALHEIPADCSSVEAHQDMTASIDGTSVSLLANMPRHVYWPAMNGREALYMLQCPVTVILSSGLKIAGYYQEWTDHDGQVETSFGSEPVHPH